MPLLMGMHDRQGAHIVPSDGWVVDVVALSENPQPTDYAALRDDINWIVRLQWGFGTTGNIPLPHEFDLMRTAAAAYAHNSNGAHIFIVGNEPNHEQERPNGIFITPDQYARCFVMCRDAIKQAHPGAQVLPAPCAPYHANPMNWLDYWREMLEIIAASGGCDGLAIHAYTRSSNPADITSMAKMGPPIEDTFSGFYTFHDALVAVPSALDRLPVYITEFNELLKDGWHDANTGVIQAAYRDVAEWNDVDDWQPIKCLILYRWPRLDKWHIEGKQGVIDDFQAAVGHGYQSPPTMGATNVQTTHIPIVSTGPSPAQPAPPPPYPDDWDPRLTERGVKIEHVHPGVPGTLQWRVTKGRWLDEQESQGRHHFYADVYANGERVIGAILAARWPGDGYATFPMEDKPAPEPGANFPLSKSRNEFSFQVNEPKHPSDVVTGVGMGAMYPDGYNKGVHTSTYIEWTLERTPTTGTGPLPAPHGPTAIVSVASGANIRSGPGLGYPVRGAEARGVAMPVIGRYKDWWQVAMEHVQGWVSDSVVTTYDTKDVPIVDVEQEPAPAPSAPGDNWSRAWPIVLEIEGGLSLDPNDSGNYYQGKLIGTKFGISAAVWGGQYDIPNLTKEQALDIYRKHYWEASEANILPWPMCLIHFDTAINHGVGVAKQLASHMATREEIYLGLRALRYFHDPKWRNFGIAWGNRVTHLDDIAKGKVNA